MKQIWEIHLFSGGFVQNRSSSSSGFEQSRDKGSPAATDRWRRRRPGGRGARVRRGKQRGAEGDLDGAFTLDREGQRDGWWQTFMAAGSGSMHGRRSGAPQTTGGGSLEQSRHGEAPEDVGTLRWLAKPANRLRRRAGRWGVAQRWRGTGRCRAAAEGAGARARGLNRGADPRSPERVRPGGAVAGVLAMEAMASGRWASRGPGELERVGPSGSAR
jgi:hypothetical protein